MILRVDGAIASSPAAQIPQTTGELGRRRHQSQKGQIMEESDCNKLNERVRELERRIGDASILLADWDGYYNPETKSGNAEELARLIEDAFTILQGKSWR